MEGGEGMLKGNINQRTLGLHAEEEEMKRRRKGEKRGKEKRTEETIVKEPLCFMYKVETSGYHSVL